MSTSDDQKKNSDDHFSRNHSDRKAAKIKEIITVGKSSGYITYDQLITALQVEQISTEQLEDVLSMIFEMGIAITEEAPGTIGPIDLFEVFSLQNKTWNFPPRKNQNSKNLNLIYLQEIERFETLSKREEIELARKIKVGLKEIIIGLCQSPLTLRAITIWRDNLTNNEVNLRDVINLGATLGNQLNQDDEVDYKFSLSSAMDIRMLHRLNDPEFNDDDSSILGDNGKEYLRQRNTILTAKEEALKPHIVKMLERISRDLSRLFAMQKARTAAMLKRDGSFTKQDEIAYQSLHSNIVELVSALNLHENLRLFRGLCGWLGFRSFA